MTGLFLIIVFPLEVKGQIKLSIENGNVGCTGLIHDTLLAIEHVGVC